MSLAALAGCGSDSKDNDFDDDGVANTEDCAPLDASKWQLKAYIFEDQDLDGWFVSSQGEACSGNELPVEYRNDAVEHTTDCDDQDSSVFRNIVTYIDEDADGIGSGQGSVTCMGNAYVDANVSIYGYDPEPNNPEVSNFYLAPAILAAP